MDEAIIIVWHQNARGAPKLSDTDTDTICQTQPDYQQIVKRRRAPECKWGTSVVPEFPTVPTWNTIIGHSFHCHCRNCQRFCHGHH